MAQYALQAPGWQWPAGEAITDGDQHADAIWSARPPGLLFESNRSVNANSALVFPSIIAADADVKIKYRFLRAGGQTFTNTGPGIVFRYGSIGNFLYFGRSNPSTNSTWAGFYRVVNGSQFSAGANFSGMSTGLWEWAWMRVRLTGNSAQLSRWLDGQAEPALGAAQAQDFSGAPESGAIGLHARAWGMAWEAGEVYIGTEGDEPPGPPMGGAISGIITDAYGTEAARIVRAHDRATGRLLAQTVSDPTTGAYSLAVPTDAEVQRIVLDDDAGDLHNDLIDRILPG